MPDKKVLILYAHPAQQYSQINSALIEQAKNFENVTVHNLYEAYPNFMFDVDYEQDLLRKHDVIVFQHPLYWYSTPAILKEWQDIVLQQGFAYGPEGKDLIGKIFTCCISAGGGKREYSQEGYNRRDLREFLYPLRQTAAVCGMDFAEPFVSYGMHYELDASRKEYVIGGYRHWLRSFLQDKKPVILEEAVKWETEL